ncbi:four-carbon acid sugar kinase family protein [Occultella glacieicola]|uniref:four-carbon acid sugar kinase family protein n=1 Tax=Occultella glacieicola TaxID=2518684 RepID=UPI001404C5E0|nr:four-carbon acid sugar kinase family protein [Occultella glacieicola]
MRPAHVWADDLTGAAEFARLWQDWSGRDVRVRLGRPGPGTVGTVRTGDTDGANGTAGDVDTVWDLDLRHDADADVLHAMTALAAGVDPTATVFVKLDSRLRGPVRVYLDALLGSGRPVVLCPANPGLGRVTVDGWHVDGSTESVDLARLGSGLPHRHLGRADYRRLPALARADGPLLITADVATPADLERLALACVGIPHATFAGSAPFLAGLLRTPDPAAPGDGTATHAVGTRAPAAVRTLLAVLGTTEPVSHAQFDALEARHRAIRIAVPADGGGRDSAVHRARSTLARGGHVALTLPTAAASAPRDRASMDSLAAACAATLAGAAPDVALLLSGGHTARLVLDRLGLRDLRTLPSTVAAVARLCAPDGRTVWTKPGSYGEPRLLLDLLDLLGATSARARS